jgi:putative ABC transport system permease protein
MSLNPLRLRNLLYHWRANSAIFLGVVVGTAVLTGALLVGDSLRGSLRDLSLRRLGWVEHSLTANAFFREALAKEVDAEGSPVVPAVLLQGTAVVQGKGDFRQARGVTVLGVDERFWSAWGQEAAVPDDTVWLNATLARELGVSEKDTVALRLTKPTEVPREALLGKKDVQDLIQEWTLPVARILKGEEPGNHFSLRPSLEAPRTVYVPLKALQQELGLGDRVNALLARGDRGALQQRLQDHLTLDDWGLTVRTPQSRAESLLAKLDRNKDGKLQPREWRDRLSGSMLKALGVGRSLEITRDDLAKVYQKKPAYLSLESRGLLLPEFVGGAAERAAKKTGLRSAPTLVYLADSIKLNSIKLKGADIPYSVVAALDPTLDPPLGPFLPEGKKTLADDEIVLARWDDWPEGLKVGDSVTLTYLPADKQHENVEKRSATFRLAGFVPLEGVSGDPDLTPEFPGITDKVRIEQWEKPFPTYDPDRVQPRDEKFWEEHRTTPKAYVNLGVGQKLWASRFGTLTSVRLAPKEQGKDLSAAAKDFRTALLGELPPDKGGFVFDPLRENALKASQGGMNYSWLFVGFSFFLIAAALLLVGLLFRLNLDRRASEVGLLFAEGYRRRQVRSLLLGEGAVLAVLGALVGTGLAVLYSRALVQLLAALWPGGALQSFLTAHANPLSLIGGAAASLVVSLGTIAWVVFVMSRVPPRALLAGQTTTEREPGMPGRPKWSWWVAGGSLLAAIALLASSGFVQGHEAKAGTFFSSGALLLTACLAGLWAWMGRPRTSSIEGQGFVGVTLLGVRNAGRYRARSLLTAGLLASAAFLIVAVESFRRQADPAGQGIDAPSGGFALLAESDLPLLNPPDSKEGRAEILDKLQLQYQEQGLDAAERQKKLDEARALLNMEGFEVVALRLRKGDDTSCLNLFKPTRPRVLGVPRSLIERGGFHFASTEGDTENPWKLLLSDKEPIPAFGEKNTVQWILGTNQGGTVTVPDGSGEERPLHIAGLLQDSVFQSSLLVSEEDFLDLYPDQEGYHYFLIRVPPEKEGEVIALLERGLADRGFEVTRTEDKLASYLAVENTYLTTFQALGGLGLILGSLGLAVVLLRSVWERRAELALLRALGFRRLTLAWLVLAENGFLLLVGLAAGTVSALASVTPQLLEQTAHIPWANLALLLAVVLVVGLAAGAVAVATTLRAPLIPALRQE